MQTSETLPQPRKHRRSINNRIVIVLFGLTTLSCIIACGALAFLYPRIGGEWASRRVIPVPPFSAILMEESASLGIYEQQVSFYRIAMSLQEARNWFNQYIVMSPFDNDLTEVTTSYRSLQLPLEEGNEYFLLNLFASLTISTSFWDGITDWECFSVELFTRNAFESTEYIDNYFSDSDAQHLLEQTNESDIIAVVERCWPRG